MDMAAVASSATQLFLKNCSQASKIPRSNATRIAFLDRYILTTKSSKIRASLVRASEPEREDANTNKNDPNDPAFLSQEDLSYLVKLGAGSVVGAAAIKYGSVVFPEITRPNITQALLIISFPVIAGVLLLIRQSRAD